MLEERKKFNNFWSWTQCLEQRKYFDKKESKNIIKRSTFKNLKILSRRHFNLFWNISDENHRTFIMVDYCIKWNKTKMDQPAYYQRKQNVLQNSFHFNRKLGGNLIEKPFKVSKRLIGRWVVGELNCFMHKLSVVIW